MKKIVFLVIILVAGYQNGYTQINLPYKPFNKFENDTTAFLDYNFNQRANQYKGLKISDVLKDLQFEPTEYVTAVKFNHTHKGDYRYISIDLYINKEGFGRYGQFICIFWQDPPKKEKVEELFKEYGNKQWTEKHYDLFKDLIVKEVVYYKRK